MMGSLPRDRCARRETAGTRHPCALAPVCTALNRPRPPPTVERVHESRRRELSYSYAACCYPQGCACGGRTARQVHWQPAQPELRRGHFAIDSRDVAQSCLAALTKPAFSAKTGAPRPFSPVFDGHTAILPCARGTV